MAFWCDRIEGCTFVEIAPNVDAGYDWRDEKHWH